MEIATKDKWKTIPMDNPKRLDVSMFLNFEQLNKLKLGLVPNQMEDKWFVYFNNDTIYINGSVALTGSVALN